MSQRRGRTSTPAVAPRQDAIPRAEKRKATADHNAAKEKAESDINIRYATAAAEVARYTYLKNKEAYDTVKNSVPWVEVMRQLVRTSTLVYPIGLVQDIRVEGPRTLGAESRPGAGTKQIST